MEQVRRIAWQTLIESIYMPHNSKKEGVVHDTQALWRPMQAEAALQHLRPGQSDRAGKGMRPQVGEHCVKDTTEEDEERWRINTEGCTEVKGEGKETKKKTKTKVAR